MEAKVFSYSLVWELMYEQCEGKLVHSTVMKKCGSLHYANQRKSFAKALQQFWH